MDFENKKEIFSILNERSNDVKYYRLPSDPCINVSAIDDISTDCAVPSSTDTALSSLETDQSLLEYRKLRTLNEEYALKEDDELSIVDDDSNSSIFSSTEFDEASDDDDVDDDDDDNNEDDEEDDYANISQIQDEQMNKEKPELISCPSIQEQWERLERSFQKCDNLLARVSKGKSAAFIRQLRTREYLSRHLQREKLIQIQLLRTKKEEKNDDFLVPDLPKDQLNECSKYQHRMSKLFDFFVFELNSTIPALFCVVLHCIAHIALYEIIYYINDELKKFVGEYFDSLQQNYDLFMVVAGALMMRMTGDVLWWLNDRDFACVKFDYHNRFKLGYWDAKVLKFVRENDVLRAVFCIYGYYLCYMGTNNLYVFVSKFFDQKESLLANLPSRDNNANFCDKVNCSSVCRAEFSLYEEEFIQSTQQDLQYTWNVMTSGSFEAYWLDWVFRMDVAGPVNYPLFSFVGQAKYSVFIIAFCVFVLRMYGFIFWQKY